jgi:GH25 family lysozyme M1 (1,4-beta-N-acetylmuramidase)
MLYGVDVHDGYQAGLSFPLLRSQGYSFAAIKLTQGTGYVRDLGDDWIRAARAAGLIPGAYHWLTAADGAAQARWFHRHVVAAGGPAGMLIQLDCEDDGYGPQMRAWASEWQRLTGGHPFLIYSGGWWWPRTGGFRGADLTPYLWHSHYLTADADTVPDDPAAVAGRIPASWWVPVYGGWPEATILQFTSRGDAGGLGNKVDLNVSRLSREQLLALTRPAGTTPKGDDGMAWDDTTSTDVAYTLLDGGEKQSVHYRLQLMRDQLAAITTAVKAIAAKVDIDPAELEAIKQAAAAGVTATVPAIVPAIVDAIVSRLPADAMTREDVEAAVRDAFAGGLAPDATP